MERLGESDCQGCCRGSPAQVRSLPPENSIAEPAPPRGEGERVARPFPIFRIRMVISAGAGDEGYCSQTRHDSLLGRNGSSEVGLNWDEVSCAESGLRAWATHGVRSAVFDFPTRR
jgi:hypothetical protein